MKYSVVVPVYNEVENIAELHERIHGVLSKMGEEYEIIFVDDGSSDETLSVAQKLSPLTLVALQKNSGQTAAMDAGIKTAQGEYVITMDGDLQNDPADIPGLIEYLGENDLDVVSGWRKNRKDPFLKHFISRGANFLRKVLINDGIHDSGCSLKVYRRKCFDTVDLYGEMHRFIPALLKIRGFKIGEKEVTHHPRKHGQTKYDWRRTVKGFLDMLSVVFWQKYVSRPMHLLGSIGVIFWLFGFVSMTFALYKKIFSGLDLSDTSLTIIAFFFFFFGLNFLIMGILFDIVTKNYYAGSKDTSYLIREVRKS